MSILPPQTRNQCEHHLSNLPCHITDQIIPHYDQYCYFHLQHHYYVSHLTEGWGHVGLPLSAPSVSVRAVSLLCCESVSHSFLSTALYRAGGQTRDVDPMLG